MLRAESDTNVSLNRRLIIARLVYNLTQQEMRDVVPKAGSSLAAVAETTGPGVAGTSAPAKPTFERFALVWARPLLRLVFDSLYVENACFHYLARDILRHNRSRTA